MRLPCGIYLNELRLQLRVRKLMQYTQQGTNICCDYIIQVLLQHDSPIC